jgi:hypothetical protein
MCRENKMAAFPEPTSDDLRNHLIEISRDPKYPLSITERAIYSLLTLPIIAQSACTEDEREAVIRNVAAAMEAAVAASKRSN